MIRFAAFETAFGPVYATASVERLTGLYFRGGRHAPPIGDDWCEEPAHPVLAECARQLHEYFAGRRTTFELPTDAAGTSFQRAVWDRIARIPCGDTVTYTEIARALGAPAAVRAVGAATGRNPLSIIVPCHRVLGSGGSLTGYAGGLDRKARLLALERGLAEVA